MSSGVSRIGATAPGSSEWPGQLPGPQPLPRPFGVLQLPISEVIQPHRPLPPCPCSAPAPTPTTSADRAARPSPSFTFGGLWPWGSPPPACRRLSRFLFATWRCILRAGATLSGLSDQNPVRAPTPAPPSLQPGFPQAGPPCSPSHRPAAAPWMLSPELGFSLGAFHPLPVSGTPSALPTHGAGLSPSHTPLLPLPPSPRTHRWGGCRPLRRPGHWLAAAGRDSACVLVARNPGELRGLQADF